MALWDVHVKWSGYGGYILRFAVESDSKEDAEKQVLDDIILRYKGEGSSTIESIEPMFEAGKTVVEISDEEDY